ncbi:double zinc ribbon domain-containing protein [Halopiger aswanensis]|uniref:Double zinc ribbon protein n=1 Tax=Halopiger aswanensis TaxID=148449 RepID=A0A419WRP6_9EURY|nr:zinc ribbon domain-containing protein [Halopiger aswanensis]RKD98163.1 double zinc ribbon protein [Halopiger aswanensis]
MGPIGWLVFVPMLLIGGYQVRRERREWSEAERERTALNYGLNCGSPVYSEGFGAVDDSDADDDGDWRVRYCSTCGVPLESFLSPGPGGSETSSVDDRFETDTDRSGSVTNCSDCGAPNDPDRTTCKHCDADL